MCTNNIDSLESWLYSTLMEIKYLILNLIYWNLNDINIILNIGTMLPAVYTLHNVAA